MRTGVGVGGQGGNIRVEVGGGDTHLVALSTHHIGHGSCQCSIDTQPNPQVIQLSAPLLSYVLFNTFYQVFVCAIQRAVFSKYKRRLNNKDISKNNKDAKTY